MNLWKVQHTDEVFTIIAFRFLRSNRGRCSKVWFSSNVSQRSQTLHMRQSVSDLGTGNKRMKSQSIGTKYNVRARGANVSYIQNERFWPDAVDRGVVWGPCKQETRVGTRWSCIEIYYVFYYYDLYKIIYLSTGVIYGLDTRTCKISEINHHVYRLIAVSLYVMQWLFFR